MVIKFYLFFISILIFNACNPNTIEIKNDIKRSYSSSQNLVIGQTKRFALDSISAPRPQYIQIIEDSSNFRYFTFLNIYDNSIYIYNYTDETYINKLVFDKESEIHGLWGYHIVSKDSIYLYSKPFVQMLLVDINGEVLKKISLTGDRNNRDWPAFYPQYYPLTANSIIFLDGKLLFPGLFLFSIPKDKIDILKFMSRIDTRTSKVDFIGSYPKSLYGSNYNWEGGLATQVFVELHPDGDKLIFSFPVSHDLYITKLYTNSEYEKIYAGSKTAESIYSINRKIRKTTGESALVHYAKGDFYSAIRYDKYRNVYYRFLLKGITDAEYGIQFKEKPVVVIIMDENFNYLGETLIGNGKNWCWQNSFVTAEGLNMEFIEDNQNEDYLSIKILTLK